MRARAMIILYLFLFALGARESYSIDWNNPGSYGSVDDLLSSGNGSPSLTEQAQAARAAEMGQPGKEIIGEHFGNNSSGSSSSRQTTIQEQNQSMSTQPVAANDKPSTASTQTRARPASVAGNWSLEIASGRPIYANITLFQSEDAVFGKGKIMDQNDSETAVASGSIEGDVLNMDLVSPEDLMLYRLSFMVSGNSVTGSNTAYSPSESPITGQARGFRS